jgi:hypothetical protein
MGNGNNRATSIQGINHKEEEMEYVVIWQNEGRRKEQNNQRKKCLIILKLLGTNY